MLFIRRALAAVALTVLGAGVASAQYGPGAGGRAPYQHQAPARNEAGRFDYYALVLSWSPTYCASLPRNSYDPQCNRRDGRRYAFVLHGLWPQYERGFPSDCPTRERPFVQRKLIDHMLDIMPSDKLVIHEYRKHGTCSGLSPEAYYDLARKAFQHVKMPPRYEGANAPFFVTPSEVIEDFVSINPGLKPANLAVVCNGPGNRLREVRICLNRDGRYRGCGRNEDQGRLCSAERMYVPPVREAPAMAPAGGQIPPQGPLPGPSKRAN